MLGLAPIALAKVKALPDPSATLSHSGRTGLVTVGVFQVRTGVGRRNHRSRNARTRLSYRC